MMANGFVGLVTGSGQGGNEKKDNLPPGLGKMNRPRDWIIDEEHLSQQLNIIPAGHGKRKSDASFGAKDLIISGHPKNGQDKPGVDLRIYSANEPDDVIAGSQLIRIVGVGENNRRYPTGEYYKILIMSPEKIPFKKLSQNESLARQAGYESAAEMVRDLERKYSRKKIDGKPVFPDGKIPSETEVSVCFTTGLRTASEGEYMDACRRFYGKFFDDWVESSSVSRSATVKAR